MQLLSEELGVVRVEGERRPQPDGGVAAAPAVHALLAQVGQDGVAPVCGQDFKWKAHESRYGTSVTS